MSEQRSTTAVQHVSLAPGLPFNPWHRACGFYPPDIVGCQHDLTDGQKRLYERAVRWAGRNGIFWRGFDSMADALGKCVRQVKADMAVLEERQLIRHRRRRRGSNLYEFLWHSIFEVQSAAHQENGLGVQDLSLEVQDNVILEVQSTAHESSQLESCPMNCVKSDNKRISGYASQKPRSDASSRLISEDKPPKKKIPKADESPSSPRSYPDAVNGWTQADLAMVRHRIVAYWRREPEEGFEISVMLRARGVTAAAVCEMLDRKFKNKNLRVGGRFAPKNQNWFLTLVENEFFPGHLPEPPASDHSDNERIEREVVEPGIEAIELADARRSIVESIVCRDCGRAALVVYTDGTVEGCGCRRTSTGIRPVSANSQRGDEMPLQKSEPFQIENWQIDRFVMYPRNRRKNDVVDRICGADIFRQDPNL